MPGPLRLDRALQLGRQLGARGKRVRRLLAGPVGIGRGDVPEPPEPRLIGAAERRASGQVERAERVAVVAAPAGDHDRAVRLAAGEVVRPGHLQGRLDRLGAAADRVDRGVADRQPRPDLGGVGLERLGGEGRAVGVRQAAELLPEDPGDRRPPVADVDDDRAARGVQVLAAGRVADRGAVRLDRDGQLRIERATEDAAGHGGECTGGGQSPIARGAAGKEIDKVSSR